MRDNAGLVWYIIGIVIALIIAGVYAYAVSVSDLPDWFKFWLLK